MCILPSLLEEHELMPLHVPEDKEAPRPTRVFPDLPEASR